MKRTCFALFAPSAMLKSFFAIAMTLVACGIETAVAADVSVGIGGYARNGFWTQCHLTASEAGAIEVAVLTQDGDGVDVRYSKSLSADAPAQCYFQVGRDSLALQIEQRNADGIVVANETIAAPQIVPTEQRWILALGSALGIDGEVVATNKSVRPLVTRIDSGEQLPGESIGYQGVDLIVLAGSDAALVNNLDDRRAEAIADWVRSGGRLVLTVGSGSIDAVDPSGWVRTRLGITLSDELVQLDSRQVESFVSAQTPLSNFKAVRLSDAGGRTLLKSRTTDRQTVPVVKEYLIGFGRVLVIAADLESEPFSSWPHRQDFLQRFLPDILGTGTSTTATRRQTDQVAYQDLVGQIRRTIDQFASHSRVPFKWIAGAIVVYLLLIGPVDYWLVNRRLRRPMMGWLTSGLMVAGFAGLACFGSVNSIPSTPVVNQFSVWDINPQDNYARGFAWSQYLNGVPDRKDWQFTIDDRLSHQPAAAVTGWWGMPGAEFGGLVAAGRDTRMPAYSIDLLSERDTRRLCSAVGSLPLATASTKGLACWWDQRADVPVQSDLGRRKGTDLLEGSFSNPLHLDLLDGMLIYRGWAYVLPTRLPPGQRISDVTSITAKNHKWRLTKRTASQIVTETGSWDAAMDNDLDRLIEVLLFHGVAGGKNYTELDNQILHGLDLSHVLQSDQAILFGRIQESPAQLIESGGDAGFETQLDKNYVRILIPVQEKPQQ